MRTFRYTATLVTMLAMTAGAWAQDAPASPDAAADATAAVLSPPVLAQIPDGTLGFVVVENIGETAGNAEKFLTDIGVAQMLGVGEQTGMSLTDMIGGAAMLREGFNPQGGFAAVMLDPQQFDIDLLEMMDMKQPAEAPAEEPKLPFVLMVPGSGIQEVFGNYQITEAGDYYKIALRMGEMIAAERPGYVLLSPRADALEALIAGVGKGAARLSENQVAMIRRSDVGAWIDMKIAGPIYTEILNKAKEQMAAQRHGPPPAVKGMMTVYIDFYNKLIAQTEDATIGLRFAETGVVAEELVDFRPDTQFGKMMTAMGDKAPSLSLTNVPNLSYILAAWGWNDVPAAREMTQDFLDDLTGEQVLTGVPSETRKQLADSLLALDGQITSAQIVAGGSVPDGGVVALSYVLKCRDSAVVTENLATLVPTIESVVKSLAGEDPDVEELTITYAKGVGKLANGTTVDQIVIDHPEIARQSDREREDVRAVLAMEKPIMHVVSADDQTVVITFGGGMPYLEKAAETAVKGGGDILDGEKVKLALKHMPENSYWAVLFNVSNLFEVIQAGIYATGDDDTIPFQLTTDAPIALGGGALGNGMHVVAYVPTEMVQEFVGAYMMMMQGMGGGGPGPGPGPMEGGEDF